MSAERETLGLRSVWKWTLYPTDIQEIAMPEGTEIIAVAEQQGELVMWGICNISAPNQTRVFAVVGTGNPAPDLSDSRHIGTVVMSYGLVWHVFEPRSSFGGTP